MKLNKSVPKIGENDMVSGTGRAYIDLSTTSELYTTNFVPAIVVQKRSRSWSVGSSIANRLKYQKAGVWWYQQHSMYPSRLMRAEYHEASSWVYVGRMEGRGRWNLGVPWSVVVSGIARFTFDFFWDNYWSDCSKHWRMLFFVLSPLRWPLGDIKARCPFFSSSRELTLTSS
jgi:hypothetical protein